MLRSLSCFWSPKSPAVTQFSGFHRRLSKRSFEPRNTQKKRNGMLRWMREFWVAIHPAQYTRLFAAPRCRTARHSTIICFQVGAEAVTRSECLRSKFLDDELLWAVSTAALRESRFLQKDGALQLQTIGESHCDSRSQLQAFDVVKRSTLQRHYSTFSGRSAFGRSRSGDSVAANELRPNPRAAAAAEGRLG